MFIARLHRELFKIKKKLKKNCIHKIIYFIMTLRSKEIKKQSVQESTSMDTICRQCERNGH